MLLAFDAGNTNITMGLFDDDKMLDRWSMHTDRNKTSDEYWLIISQIFSHAGIQDKQIKDIIIASVVTQVLKKLVKMAVQRLNIEPIIIKSDINMGMEILYDNPGQLGVDRIVNAIGGYAIYGGPLIIVDLGTATTFDVVSEDGIFLGGAIAPGMETSVESLWSKAPALPKVDIAVPPRAIGKDTISNLLSGFYFGFLGQMEEIIRRIEAELPEKPKVIATGGLATTIARDSNLVNHVDPDLTLNGLQIIFNRMKNANQLPF